MIDEMQTNNDTEQLTIKEAATFLGISPAGVSARIFKGKLKAEKINGKQYIARDELEKIKQSNTPTKQHLPQEAEILSGVINMALQQSQDGTKIITLEEITTQIRIWNISTERDGEQAICQILFDGRGYSIIS